VFTEDAQWLAPPANATALALRGSHHMVGRDAIVRFSTVDFPKLFVRDVSGGRIAFVREYMDTQRGAQCIFG